MITIILKGGLGNQMFQYASAKSLSMRLNAELRIDLTFINKNKNKSWCRPYELEIFKHSASIKKTNINDNFIIFLLPILIKFKIGIKILRLLNYYIEDSSFHSIFSQLKNGCTLFGTFPDENYFIDYQNEILKDFTFNKPLNDINRKIAELIGQSNSISIHIRRGDYLNSQNYQLYTHCSVDWYMHAIQYIKKNTDSPVFFFFSDDMKWVKESFSFVENVHFVDINSGPSAYNDMQLMSMCKHNIIANSTFSWWGAWMNLNPDKIVIAPKNYFQDENNNKFRPILMPKNWILL